MSEVTIFVVGCVMSMFVATGVFLYGWLWLDAQRAADDAQVIPVEGPTDGRHQP